MTAPAAKLLPFYVVCPTCHARRYDEGNRRHVTVLIDGEFSRYVCLDVVVPSETNEDDVALVLNKLTATLLGAATEGVHFVRAS